MLSDQSVTNTQAASVGETSVNEQRLCNDKVFHLLQNRRRRDVIRYLQNADEETVSMRDIAEQVAAWEHDTSVQALTSDERQRVYIPLYQNHLPKLDDEGVIDYNQSRGTVERTPVADQLEQYLSEGVDEPASPPASDDEESSDVDWVSTYLGATGLSGAFFLMAVVGVPLVSSVPDLLLAALILATFATVTYAHALSKP